MQSPPSRPADDFERLLLEQAGVLTTAQAERLLRPGVWRGHLRLARWRRVCRGVLLAENGSLSREQQLWVAVLVSGRGAHIAGRTAATQGGVKGLRTNPIEVIMPAERRRSARLPRLPPDMPAVRAYRTAVLPASHCQATSPPRTTVARAVIDGAAWASGDHEARDLIARACQQGHVTVAELRDVLHRFPAIRRHRLMVRTIADIEGGATALSEIGLIKLCHRYRLPLPDLQRLRTDASGRRRFVDAHWTSSRLLVELDGSHHMDVGHWSADMLRQNEIWIAGDRILRFPTWLLRSDPATVATQIRQALSAGSNAPTP